MSGNRTGSAGLRRRTLRVVGLSLVAALGLLLWARLKLVTDTPRMVYADPKPKQVGGAGGGAGDTSPGVSDADR